jgi:hypothetical protein
MSVEPQVIVIASVFVNWIVYPELVVPLEVSRVVGGVGICWIGIFVSDLRIIPSVFHFVIGYRFE